MRIGDKVVCVKGGTGDHDWKEGEEIIIHDIQIVPYGIFLYNDKEQNISIKRVKLVIEKEDRTVKEMDPNNWVKTV